MKREIVFLQAHFQNTVFIHRSNKTRIETRSKKQAQKRLAQFLYIDPIKQGLKLNKISKLEQNEIEFLYIDPIKQGLKRLYQTFPFFLSFCFYT